MSEPRKHHYIPVFYLKKWARSEKGQLCEHKLVAGHGAKPRRTAPKGTGYQTDLYRINGVPEEVAQQFEKRFMHFVDDRASRALEALISGHADSWDGEMRSSWARFVVSLFFRNPEAIATIKSLILEMWETALKSRHWENDRTVLEAFFAMDAADFLADLIASDRVAKTIFEMNWSRVDVSKSFHQLLTSDRPLVMPLGLDNPNAYISLPVSPQILFVASHSNRSIFADANPTWTARTINEEVVAQARTYVWGTTDAQLAFIQKRFGKLPDRVILTAQQRQDALDAVAEWRHKDSGEDPV